MLPLGRSSIGWFHFSTVGPWCTNAAKTLDPPTVEETTFWVWITYCSFFDIDTLRCNGVGLRMTWNYICGVFWRIQTFQQISRGTEPHCQFLGAISLLSSKPVRRSLRSPHPSNYPGQMSRACFLFLDSSIAPLPLEAITFKGWRTSQEQIYWWADNIQKWNPSDLAPYSDVHVSRAGCAAQTYAPCGR